MPSLNGGIPLQGEGFYGCHDGLLPDVGCRQVTDGVAWNNWAGVVNGLEMANLAEGTKSVLLDEHEHGKQAGNGAGYHEYPVNHIAFLYE